jgi:hypothetical protein
MLIGSPPAELAMRCIRRPDAFRKSRSRSLRRSSSGVRTSPGAERMMQKQNALIDVANRSAARAEAHSIIVESRNGPRTRSRGRDCPVASVQQRRCPSKPRSSRPTAVAPRLLRPFGPLSHAPLEILEVVVDLLKCKPQCEEAFRRIAWKSSRETFATKRNDLGSISSESRFHRVKRRRTPTLLQRRRTRPQVICYSHFGMRDFPLDAQGTDFGWTI